MGPPAVGGTPPERILIERVLEQFTCATAETVINRFAIETSKFDRGRFRTLLWEEHIRRLPRTTETPEWKTARDLEKKRIDEFLRAIPPDRRSVLIAQIRKERPELFRFLRTEPMETEIGRAIIYCELQKLSPSLQ